MIYGVEESRKMMCSAGCARTAHHFSGQLTERKIRFVGNYDELLLQGLALGLAASVSPGPFQAYLINQTLTNGFRRAAPVAFAPLIADIPIVVASLLLLDQLSPEFLRFIHIAGGLFVLYMAFGLWRSWSRSTTQSQQPDNSETLLGNGSTGNPVGSGTPPATVKSSLGRGVIMNLFSPGPYTFWFLVSGPILVSALRQSTGSGLAFLLGFYGALIGGFLGIAALFHQARRLGPRVVRALSLASILILVAFGIILLKRGIWG
jgi:threonine/homoserine/homoserine lactone efflux protein